MNASLFADPLVRRGAVGTVVVVAFGLLAGFHLLVAGAVDRAAEKRVAVAATRVEARSEEASARAARSAVAVPALPNAALAGAAYAPRTVAYRSSR